MAKVKTLNEATQEILGSVTKDFKPVENKKSLISDYANYLIAKEIVKDYIDKASAAGEVAKNKLISDAESGGDKRLNVALAILSHVASIKQLSSSLDHKSMLSGTALKGKDPEEARTLLNNFFDRDIDKKPIADAIFTNAKKNIEEIQAEKEEEPEEEAEEPEEPEAEEAPEEEKANKGAAKIAKEVSQTAETKPETKPESSATPAKENDPASTTPKFDTSIETIKGKTPSSLAKEFEQRFEQEAQKARERSKKMGYNERGTEAAITKIRAGLTKNLNKMLGQEDALTGNYGYNTKSRAQQAINIAANNSNYLIDTLGSKAFLKASPNDLQLLVKHVGESGKKAVDAFKRKAEQVASSRIVQTAVGEGKKAFETIKGKTAETLDKIASNIEQRDQKNAVRKEQNQAFRNVKKAQKIAVLKDRAEKKEAKKTKLPAEPTATEEPDINAELLKKNADMLKQSETPQEEPKKKGFLSRVRETLSKKKEPTAKKAHVTEAPAGTKLPSEREDQKVAAMKQAASGKTPQQISTTKTPAALPAPTAAAPAAPAAEPTPAPTTPALPAPTNTNLPAVAKPTVPAKREEPKPGEPNYAAWLREKSRKRGAASVNTENKKKLASVEVIRDAGDEKSGEDRMASNAAASTNTEKKRKEKIKALKNKL